MGSVNSLYTSCTLKPFSNIGSAESKCPCAIEAFGIDLGERRSMPWCGRMGGAWRSADIHFWRCLCLDKEGREWLSDKGHREERNMQAYQAEGSVSEEGGYKKMDNRRSSSFSSPPGKGEPETFFVPPSPYPDGDDGHNVHFIPLPLIQTRPNPKPNNLHPTSYLIFIPPHVYPNGSIQLRTSDLSQGRILPDRTYVPERFRWVSPVCYPDWFDVGQGSHAVFCAKFPKSF